MCIRRKLRGRFYSKMIQLAREHPNTVKIPHPSYAWFASQLQGGPEQYILSIIHSLEPVDLRKYIPRGYCCPKLQKTAPSMPFCRSTLMKDNFLGTPREPGEFWVWAFVFPIAHIFGRPGGPLCFL